MDPEAVPKEGVHLQEFTTRELGHNIKVKCATTGVVLNVMGEKGRDLGAEMTGPRQTP